jgi:lipid-binding SYLF domain-containing protein
MPAPQGTQPKQETEMIASMKRWAATATILSTLALGATPAFAGADQQADIDHAIGTLQDLRHDKAFGNARQLLQTARAVLIAPRIFKAGFFFGGQGGDAVLMVRGPHGWSDPAFYTIASASFGLQIGAAESEMIIIIRSDRALRAVMRDRFKIGADAGLAVATLGSDVEGATTANAGADIIVWASSAGAYAGITLNGSLIEPQRHADESYYGRPVTTGDIVLRHDVSAPGASALRRTLDSIS